MVVLGAIALAGCLGLAGCGVVADLADLADLRLMTSPHLMLGNPSDAATRLELPNNYLLIKPQFALSYSRDRGTANWVSWQLNPDWLGEVDRQNNFRPDPDLPADWPVITSQDYRGRRYDRGHLAPSGDRTASIEDNSATFVMSNIIPQSPDNNRGPWSDLESASRQLVSQGRELYILAGPIGQQGRIGSAQVVVPQSVWKIIVVMEEPGLEAGEISEATRVIAVNLPNVSGIGNRPWQDFITTVDELEELTGFDFLSTVDDDVEAVIERRADGG
ncbi:MAG: DNA/RNA non-specific endonuclease [Synechococcales cyanobacterium RM1_1_8]|nr:DNA/RNA non-specific endonuclease [Synechococcales cyanobacterium RM1_1_8]